MRPGYAVFPTALGPCGVSWSASGLRSVELPGASVEDTEERLRARAGVTTPTAPPKAVERAIERITRHLDGQPQDLAEIALDMAGVPDFHRSVYEALRAVGPGRTTTYGELAARLGSPLRARRRSGDGAKPVGARRPCHRVLGKDGAPTGFSAAGGVVTKARILALEGVTLRAEKPQLALFHGEAALSFDWDEAVRHIAAADPVMGAAMARSPGRLRLERTQSIYAALAESIVHQQLSGKAAATIFGRVKALYPKKPFPTPRDILATDEAKLRGAGLSQAKYVALCDLARKVQDGTVPTMAALDSLADDEIVERLSSVRGIGRWTAEMVLIFRLGRPDVLPVDDLGVRKGYARAFGLEELPRPKVLLALGEKWRPYRTVAAWYCWRFTEWA